MNEIKVDETSKQIISTLLNNIATAQGHLANYLAQAAQHHSIPVSEWDTGQWTLNTGDWMFRKIPKPKADKPPKSVSKSVSKSVRRKK